MADTVGCLSPTLRTLAAMCYKHASLRTTVDCGATDAVLRDILPAPKLSSRAEMASLDVPTGAKKSLAGMTWRRSTGVGSLPSSMRGTARFDRLPSSPMLCTSIWTQCATPFQCIALPPLLTITRAHSC